MDFRRYYYDTEITNKGVCFSQPRENHSWVQQFKILKYSTGVEISKYLDIDFEALRKALV